jgi:hypothetical protein
MLGSLAEKLRDEIEQLRKFASQPTCPAQYRNSPLAIGSLPATPDEWWQHQRRIVEADLKVMQGLLSRYETAIQGESSE